MSQQSEPAAGSIYDLGYRRYDGVRLGRRHAMLSLYFFSLRAAFGLGRRATSKIIPFAIAIVAAIPATIQLGIGALVSSEDISLIRPENYFTFIEVAIALFCATIAPEVVGRDQRNHTLPLYFSRALSRRDYTFAKLGALLTALLALSLVPQAILFFGNSLASKDAGQFWRDHWGDLPQILASGVLVAAFMASLSMLIAAQTPRRAYATISVIAVYLVTAPIASTLIQGIGGDFSRWVVFLSPFDLLEGATFWIFGVAPDADSNVAVADFPAWAFGAITAGIALLCGLLLERRYRRLAV